MTDRRLATDPEWQADACYFRGRSHEVCEDYAHAGQLGDGRSFAIVADGCSSSVDTDVGARLLVRAVSRGLSAGCPDLRLAAALRRAAACARATGLAPTALDATLMVAVTDGAVIRIAVAGDGVVAARRTGGAVETWELDYGGAPGYPSYALDPARLGAWLAVRGERTVTHRSPGQAAHQYKQRLAPSAPLATGDGELVWPLVLDAARYDAVVLLSDGAASFASAAGAVATEEVIAEVLAIRSRRGAFLARRLRRFLGHGCSARGWYHDDDLGAAGLCRLETAAEGAQ